MKLADFLEVIDIEILSIVLDSRTICTCNSDSPVLDHYKEFQIEEIRPSYASNYIKIFLKK